MNVLELLFRQAEEQADRPAFVMLRPDLEVGESLSYAQLANAASAMAKALREQARPGDRVLLAFDNSLEAVQLFWACLVAGLIAIPAPAPDLRRSTAGQRRLQAIVGDAQVALAFADEDHVAAAREQAPDVPWQSLKDLMGHARCDGSLLCHGDAEPDSPATAVAYLQYTSGSTGQPRGVEIAHAHVLAQCHGLAQVGGVVCGTSRSLTWLPWFHDYGLVHGVLLPVVSGMGSTLMSTQQFLLRPLRWLEAIARHGITHSGAPDFAYAACARALARTPDWPHRLDSWTLATCGAEPIRLRTMTAFVQAFSRSGFRPEAFTPCYGLAESVLAVSLGNARQPPVHIHVDADALEKEGKVRQLPAGAPAARSFLGCGQALPGLDVRIVNPQTGRACQADEVGEVWVSGSSVAGGYWGQPEVSAQRFSATLAGEPVGSPERYLRTGDLGFLLGGELFITGRCKDLIVVHGRNLYPQDLEDTAQGADASIRPGGVAAVSIEKDDRECVVLLVECRQHISPGAAHRLQLQLRQEMALAHDVELLDVVLLRGGVLPRTSSGKLQRSAARQMYLDAAWESRRVVVATTGEQADTPSVQADEQTIAQLGDLWADVLGLDSVPADGHFLALGGDSLTGTQLLSRVRERLGVDMPISVLFADPSLRGMAQELERRRTMSSTQSRLPGGAAQALVADEKPADGGQQVLSFSQERMWFMHALAPASGAYNVPAAIRLSGHLDPQALAQALRAVVVRHQILRTRYVASQQGPIGELVSDADIQLVQLDIQAPQDQDTQARLSALMSKLSQQPFALDQWPLMRAWLIRLEDRQHVLLITLHHIVADQWTFAVLARDLALAYNAARSGEAAPWPGPAPAYADYARWHRRWFDASRRALETAYWTDRLAGLQALELNTDFPRPRVPSFRGGSVRVPLALGDTQALTRLAAAQDASLAMALLALFKVFLHRHTGQTDIAVGMPIANRHNLVSEELVGTLVNTLVVRTSLDGEPDYLEVLRRVRSTALAAHEHQDMPFEVLVRELAHDRGSGRPPLFNVMFNVVNTPIRDAHFDGLQWSRVDVSRRSAQVDLMVIVDASLDRSIVLEYATDLFLPETAERMGRHLQALIRAAVGHTQRPVCSWPMLDEREQVQLQAWGTGPELAIPPLSLAAFLEIGLGRNPDAIALVFEERQITYRQLDQDAWRLARLMSGRGAGHGTRVGLCLNRSVELVTALLATIRAGATYVPLDPAYPRERLSFQIQDAELGLLVTTEALIRDLGLTHENCLVVGEGMTGPVSPQDSDLAFQSDPGSPAYLIYTSGSTGRPKGVAVPQQAVVNFLDSMAREPGMDHRDRVLAVTTLGFDIAVLELLLPLSLGATVVLASDSQLLDARALAALMDRHAVTLMQATPSRWHLLLDSGWRGRPGLRALVGGEPLAPELAHTLCGVCDQVWNMYGPTETTVWSTCWRVQPQRPVSLGQPIANTRLVILDESGQPSALGVPGEIWIGGAGLAHGYWGQPELTAQRFQELDPLGEACTMRWYRTGDRGRWHADGTLEHQGRLDDQVKLRGHRIELGEIEARLAMHPEVQRCVVMVREDRPGDRRLVAYLVPRQAMPEPTLLRQHLKAWLPEHMVPGHFVPVQAIPVLPNGKTDRRSLPAPPSPAPHGTDAGLPRNATEQKVWQIWRDVLQLEQLGLDDNFFDLGGHSMLAVRLAARIEAGFDRPFPLGLLFDAPTVAQMAQALQETSTHRDVPVLTLKPGTSEQGLFLLAGAQIYQSLAQLLETDMPVYGLFTQTEIDLLEWPTDKPLPHLSIEQLATEYLDQIRRHQAHGPYHLGGFSIGGVLAYEVAQRLMREGEKVERLVMLDCMLPGRDWRRLQAGIVRRMRLLRKEGWGHVAHVYRQLRRQTTARGQVGGRRNQVYAEAIRQYHAQASDLSMLYFRAEGDVSTAAVDGWARLVRDLVVAVVPGKHMDMLEAPNVAVLASRLQEQLVGRAPTFHGPPDDPTT